MSDTITVALVEDDPDLRESLRLLLKGTPGFECVGAYSTAEEALAKIVKAPPAVILMDIHLPGISGTRCVREIKARLPAARVMMLSVFEDHDRIFDALRAGASVYLTKATPPAKLLEAIRDLHEGGAPMSGSVARQVVAAFQEPANNTDATEPLSEREREVLQLLSRGLLYKEIAAQLGISIATVRTHIGRIYGKLHVRSRAEAMFKTISGSPPRKK